MRVSTDEQAISGLGLAAQRAAIEAECARRGWTLVAVHEDPGVSGKSMDRPGLAAALADVEQGRAAALVVSKVDRLSRSSFDFVGLLEAAQRGRWNLVALDVNVDTTTPQGEMMASVMAIFAQLERRLIGQRTRDALAAKKAQGVRLGRPQLLPAEVVERIRSEHAAGGRLVGHRPPAQRRRGADSAWREAVVPGHGALCDLRSGTDDLTGSHRSTTVEPGPRPAEEVTRRCRPGDAQ